MEAPFRDDSVTRRPWQTHRGLFAFTRTRGQVEVWRCPFESDWNHFDTIEDFSGHYVDPRGEWMVCGRGHDIILHSLVDPGFDPERIGWLPEKYVRFRADPNLGWVATYEPGSTVIKVWALGTENDTPQRVLDSKFKGLDWGDTVKTDRQGRYLSAGGFEDDPRWARIWDLHAPNGADPLVLRIPDAEYLNGVSFDPTSRWAVTGVVWGVAFWPISSHSPIVFSDHGTKLSGGAFTPDGSEIVFSVEDVGLKTLPAVLGASSRLVPVDSIKGGQAFLDSEGRFAIANSHGHLVVVVPLDGSPSTTLEGFDQSASIAPIAYDPKQKLVAAAPHLGPRDQKVIRVWSLRDGSEIVLGPADDAGEGFEGGYRSLAFLPDGRLLSIGKGSLRRWNLDDGSSEAVMRGLFHGFSLSPDKTAIATRTFDEGTIFLFDLETREIRRLPEYGDDVWKTSFGPQPGVFAAASLDGTIRVGRIGHGEPHHLFGHTRVVMRLVFSPDGRWLMSCDRGSVVRIWPVPDLSKPAPHTLPYDEFLAKLDEFTNLRYVRDENSPTGWSRDLAPFPGWAEVPEW